MSITRRRDLSLSVAAIGVLVTLLAANMLGRHLSARQPHVVWGVGESMVWVIGVSSCLAAIGGGAWLIWRLPANVSGWWLSASGYGLAIWILGSYWPNAASPWIEQVLPSVCKAAAAYVVWCWPTGRLPPRARHVFRALIAGYLLVGVGTQFIGDRYTPWWPEHEWSMPNVGGLMTGTVVQLTSLVLLGAVAPAILLAAVHRRWATMPPSLRRTSTPAIVAAVVLGAAELVSFASSIVITPIDQQHGQRGSLGRLGLGIDVGRYGLVAALLVASESRRRRAQRSNAATSIDLGVLDASIDDVTAMSHEVSRILGDPSARVVIGTPGDTGRARMTIADRDGHVVAAIDHDAGVEVNAATRDAVMASIGMAVMRQTRASHAAARTAELRAVQRMVIDAQDGARRRLERNLHDGVQQRLVALSIDASLLARREGGGHVTDDDRETFRRSILDTVAFSHALLVDDGADALDGGLAAALAVLCAATPVATSLHVEGDVPPSQSEASALWFVASEAVANSLKHGRARHLSIRLAVVSGVVELSVTDDGRGGVVAAPHAIAQRLAEFDAALTVVSPPGRGTAVHVRLPLAAPIGVS